MKTESALLKAVRENWSLIIATVVAIGMTYTLVYRLTSLEHAFAAHIEDVQIRQDRVEEILIRLTVMETKLDRNNKDVEEIKQDVKELHR